MSSLKKFILSLCMVTGMCIALSIPAFAVDEPSGEPGVDYPVSFVFEPSETDQYGFLIFDGTNYYYFYFNVVWADNYGPNDIVFFPYFSTGWSSTKSRIAVGYFITNSSITSDTVICTCQGIYRADTSSSTGINLAGSRAVKGRYNRYYYLWDRGIEILDTTISDTYKMQILLQTNWSDGVYRPMVFYDNLPSQMYSYDSLTSVSQFYGSRNIVLDGFYYEFGNGLTNFHATDSDSLISGTIDGTITDGNGNSQDVNLNVDLDIPDKEFSNGVEYPDLSSVNDAINDNMTDLEIMDTSGSAFEFIYDRINDIAHGNNKILVMFTSCLSVGVIMMLLNKRSG